MTRINLKELDIHALKRELDQANLIAANTKGLVKRMRIAYSFEIIKELRDRSPVDLGTGRLPDKD